MDQHLTPSTASKSPPNAGMPAGRLGRGRRQSDASSSSSFFSSSAASRALGSSSGTPNNGSSTRLHRQRSPPPPLPPLTNELILKGLFGKAKTEHFILKEGQKFHRRCAEDAPYPLPYDRILFDHDTFQTLYLFDKYGSPSLRKVTTPPRRVLDIGCGRGDWVIEAAKHWPETEFIGIDIVPNWPSDLTIYDPPSDIDSNGNPIRRPRPSRPSLPQFSPEILHKPLPSLPKSAFDDAENVFSLPTSPIPPLTPTLGTTPTFTTQRPSNPISDRVEFRIASFLDPLPFEDQSFDFVHIKSIAAGVPEHKWNPFLEEVVRVTKSGGWIELIERNLALNSAGISHSSFRIPGNGSVISSSLTPLTTTTSLSSTKTDVSNDRSSAPGALNPPSSDVSSNSPIPAPTDDSKTNVKLSRPALYIQPSSFQPTPTVSHLPPPSLQHMFSSSSAPPLTSNHTIISSNPAPISPLAENPVLAEAYASIFSSHFINLLPLSMIPNHLNMIAEVGQVQVESLWPPASDPPDTNSGPSSALARRLPLDTEPRSPGYTSTYPYAPPITPPASDASTAPFPFPPSADSTPFTHADLKGMLVGYERMLVTSLRSPMKSEWLMMNGLGTPPDTPPPLTNRSQSQPGTTSTAPSTPGAGTTTFGKSTIRIRRNSSSKPIGSLRLKYFKDGEGSERDLVEATMKSNDYQARIASDKERIEVERELEFNDAWAIFIKGSSHESR
ncbi:hypothetical protein FRC02_002696 [Tulasnella sp. 418]|nr:hypothetical protein FRC02_002696 [Tulasnella sp. 418]